MKQQKETICYLVRHGHPQLPDGRKYYLGRTDLPLSPQGIAQAQWLEQFFARPPVAAICHSPLCGCRQTAEIIGGQRIPYRPGSRFAGDCHGAVGNAAHGAGKAAISPSLLAAGTA